MLAAVSPELAHFESHFSDEAFMWVVSAPPWQRCSRSEWPKLCSVFFQTVLPLAGHSHTPGDLMRVVRAKNKEDKAGARRLRNCRLDASGHGQTKVENIATDGQKVGKVGKVAENVAMDGVRIEEKYCKSSMKGLARRSRERHAMLAEMEEEIQDVVCVDDIIVKELP